MLIIEFISMIINILLFAVIPFFWYLVKRKRVRGFLKYLGVYRPGQINLFEITTIIVPVYLIVLTANLLVIALGYSGRSFNTDNYTVLTLFLSLLFYGMKTGIAEEIFFRGFIAKKVIDKLGYSKGNLIQAVIFGMLHFVIQGSASRIDIIVRIIGASLLGYTFGYVMDKKSNGSIIPVMVAHILINMLSSYIMLTII